MAARPTTIRFVNPSTLATPPGYTHVVEITEGRTIFIAGQIALDQSGQIVGLHDFRAQTQRVFEHLREALTAVGADLTHVIKSNIYVLDTPNSLLYVRSASVMWTAITLQQAPSLRYGSLPAKSA